VSFRVLLYPKAAKSLKKLNERVGLEIQRKLELLGDRPELGKRLRYSNFWSLRVGDHRVIYEIRRVEKQVAVLFIGHRRRVYEDFSKLF